MIDDYKDCDNTRGYSWFMGSETHGSFWGSIPMPKKPRSVDVLAGIDYFASEASESLWESMLSPVQDAVTQALRQDKKSVPTFL